MQDVLSNRFEQLLRLVFEKPMSARHGWNVSGRYMDLAAYWTEHEVVRIS
jgi:hypothetical protein